MLKFTYAQFDALDRQAAAHFKRRIVDHLKASLPAAEAPLIEAQASAGIEHAAAHGIDTHDEVLQFLWLRHRFGPDFDREAWAQPLHSAEPDARIRMEATAALLKRSMARP